MNLNNITPIFANTGVPGFVFIFAIPWIAAPILAVVNFVLILRYAEGTRAWHTTLLGACAVAAYVLLAQSEKSLFTDILLILVPLLVFGQFLWLLHTRKQRKSKIEPP